MTKIKNLLALVTMTAVTLCIGCSHTKQVGRIGDLELYKVSLRGLDTPNITALATRNVQNNEVNFITSANGAGLGPALVSAVGGAGAAAVNGVSLRPASTRVNNNSGSNSQTGDTSATGGAGGAGGSGQGYGSAGATSSSSSQSGANAQSDSWSGVIGSGNTTTTINTTKGGNNGNGGNPHNY